MPEFVLCEHPDLPGERVRMAKPRNGWVPVESTPAPKRRSSKRSRGRRPQTSPPVSDENQDDPTAGQSEPTTEEN